jgi:PadR family transcriptional regulator, regulatory protein PadR
MRRKVGALVPLEVSILEAAAELQLAGQPEVHGYQLAGIVRDMRQARRLTAYGTLYKALARLEREGFLGSRWEDPSVGAAESRPRRRFYRLTLEGEGALAEARASAPATGTSRAAATPVT